MVSVKRRAGMLCFSDLGMGPDRLCVPLYGANGNVFSNMFSSYSRAQSPTATTPVLLHLTVLQLTSH